MQSQLNPSRYDRVRGAMRNANAMREAPRSAWLLPTATLMVAAAGLALLAWDWSTPVPRGFFGIRGFYGLFAAGFGGVGALLNWRRPGHPVGWIFAVAGLLAAVNLATFEYGGPGGPSPARRRVRGLGGAVDLGTVRHADHPVLVLAVPGRAPAHAALAPGRLAGRRVRGHRDRRGGVDSRLGPAGPARPAQSVRAGPGGGAARRGRGRAGRTGVLRGARGVVAGGAQPAGDGRGAAADQVAGLLRVSGGAGPDARGGPVADPGVAQARVASGAVSAAVLAMPAAVAVAVLRYRLYDIDRIISRTLAYAIITGVLAGVYAALVLLATGMLGMRTPVAVAAATLAAAALFAPVRRRVQHAADRRFNRDRYDADQTVAAFAARLKRGRPGHHPRRAGRHRANHAGTRQRAGMDRPAAAPHGAADADRRPGSGRSSGQPNADPRGGMLQRFRYAVHRGTSTMKSSRFPITPQPIQTPRPSASWRAGRWMGGRIGMRWAARRLSCWPGCRRSGGRRRWRCCSRMSPSRRRC